MSTISSMGTTCTAWEWFVCIYLSSKVSVIIKITVVQTVATSVLASQLKHISSSLEC